MAFGSCFAASDCSDDEQDHYPFPAPGTPPAANLYASRARHSGEGKPKRASLLGGGLGAKLGSAARRSGDAAGARRRAAGTRLVIGAPTGFVHHVHMGADSVKPSIPISAFASGFSPLPLSSSPTSSASASPASSPEPSPSTLLHPSDFTKLSLLNDASPAPHQPPRPDRTASTPSVAVNPRRPNLRPKSATHLPTLSTFGSPAPLGAPTYSFLASPVGGGTALPLGSVRQARPVSLSTSHPAPDPARQRRPQTMQALGRPPSMLEMGADVKAGRRVSVNTIKRKAPPPVTGSVIRQAGLKVGTDVTAEGGGVKVAQAASEVESGGCQEEVVAVAEAEDGAAEAGTRQGGLLTARSATQ